MRQARADEGEKQVDCERVMEDMIPISNKRMGAVLNLPSYHIVLLKTL